MGLDCTVISILNNINLKKKMKVRGGGGQAMMTSFFCSEREGKVVNTDDDAGGAGKMEIFG